MSFVFGIVGGFIIVFVFKDLITTTLSFKGGGRMTNFITYQLWQLFLKLSKYNGRSSWLDHVGYIILIFIVLTWVFSMWLGFFLILLSDPDSIINSTTSVWATAWEKLYFVGYSISTLGNGDFKPGSNFWRIVTTIFALFGLALITISITYIMPVLSAVILQIKLSVFINSMGNSPQQILANAWNGKNFDRLLTKDTNISDLITQHSQNHKAYPVIHYFHNCQLRRSVVVNLAALDEAINMLLYVVAEEHKPDKKDLALLRGALDFYLEVLREGREISQHAELPETDWLPLKQEGILLDKTGQENYPTNTHLKERRKVLNHLLQQEGWSWHEVYADEE